MEAVALRDAARDVSYFEMCWQKKEEGGGYWVGECWDTTVGGNTKQLNDRLEKNGKKTVEYFRR